MLFRLLRNTDHFSCVYWVILLCIAVHNFVVFSVVLSAVFKEPVVLQKDKAVKGYI